MKKYCVISPEGRIENIVNWDGETDYDVSPSTLRLYEEGDEIYQDEIVDVPQQATQRQIRRALRRAGLLDQVNALVRTMGPDAEDDWEYASVIQRDDALINGGAKALGLSDEDVDNLFILAVTFN